MSHSPVQLLPPFVFVNAERVEVRHTGEVNPPIGIHLEEHLELLVIYGHTDIINIGRVIDITLIIVFGSLETLSINNIFYKKYTLHQI